MGSRAKPSHFAQPQNSQNSQKRINDQPIDETAELLALVAGGCRASFGSLYSRNGGRLFAVILRITRDPGHAEEVLQETFIRVWHQCRHFDAEKASAGHWLTCIARHAAIDNLRRRECRPQISHGASMDVDDPYAGMLSPAGDPHESLVSRRQAAVVRRCLSELPPEQRQSLTLAYFDGLSHSEIALHLGRPLGTVKSWVRRALTDMKTSLHTLQ